MTNRLPSPDLPARHRWKVLAAGVAAISNSYGGSEASSETTTDSSYNHPGLAITVSSGDDAPLSVRTCVPAL